ncbi:MAG TPA: ATP-binding protein, partial [Acidimicrobiales bacterium]|nr:ATP-binding protein [Acidimicrobiales bacterium]
MTPVPGPVGGDAGGSTLLERDPALELARRAAARAACGSPRVVALMGPAGSGRSALLAEVGDALGDAWARCTAGASPSLAGGPTAGRGTARRPVAVLLDDADEQPDEVLAALAGRLDGGEVALVALALLPGSVSGDALRRLLDRPGTQEVPLRPLSLAAVRTLVVQVLGRDDPDLAALVHRRSGGLPALAVALLDDPVDPLPAGAARRARRLLDRCPDDVRAVVELLAVAPRPVPVDALEPASSRAAVVAARDAGLVVLREGGARAHPPLLGEVVLAELDTRRRERRQRELARCWMAHRDPCPSSIAALLEAAGDRRGASAFHVRAAEDALRTGDPDLAQSHFARAQRSGAAFDADTLERAARAAASAGRPGAAERWARGAEDAHRTAGDHAAARRVWQHPELAYIRRTALEGVELDRGSPLRQATDAEAAARRRDPRARSLASCAAVAARDAGDSDALGTAGLALLLAGAADESRAVHEELRQRALERADAASEAAQLRALARVALAVGDPLAALLHARAGVLAAEREPGTVVRAFQQIHLATMLTLTGDLDEAEAIAEPLAAHPDPTVVAIAGIPRAGLALAGDEPRVALALLAPLLPHRDAAGPDAFSGVLLQVAEAHVLLDDADRARAALDELDAFAGGTLEPTRADALAIAGRLAARAGDRDGVAG